MTWDLVGTATGRVVEAWALRLILAFCVAIIMWRAASLSRRAFERAATRSGADPNVRLLAARLLYAAVLLLGLIWILGIVGVEQASILATFGVFGLALSLAAQDILKSFFAGLYLLFERPFLLGDEVQIRDHVGRVDNIGFRATSLRTEDNVLVVVPNSIVFAEVVSNRATRIERPPAQAESDSPGSGPNRSAHGEPVEP